MHFYYSMDEWELYDLENDPSEMHNIYNEVSNDSLIQLLKQNYMNCKFNMVIISQLKK